MRFQRRQHKEQVNIYRGRMGVQRKREVAVNVVDDAGWVIEHADLGFEEPVEDIAPKPKMPKFAKGETVIAPNGRLCLVSDQSIDFFGNHFTYFVHYIDGGWDVYSELGLRPLEVENE